MKYLDKAALLIMLITISMLDSDSYIPYIICFVSVIYLLVRLIRGDLDV